MRHGQIKVKVTLENIDVIFTNNAESPPEKGGMLANPPS